MTKTAAKTGSAKIAQAAAKVAAAPSEDKAPRTRYSWTDELKKEIAAKLDLAKRGERDEILEEYSKTTGVAPASIYAVVNSYRTKTTGRKPNKNMSATQRLAALKAEQEALQAEVVAELQNEHAANLARNAEIEATLASMEAPLVAEVSEEEVAA